jgi:hypothetical protein
MLSADNTINPGTSYVPNLPYYVPSTAETIPSTPVTYLETDTPSNIPLGFGVSASASVPLNPLSSSSSSASSSSKIATILPTARSFTVQAATGPLSTATAT